jgi:Protein of unknown function (DUF2510)
MTDVPAGWYDDPEHADQHRYWDGAQWTEHRAPKAPAPRGRSGSVWQVVPDTFSLLGRCWRELVVIVSPVAVLLVAGAVILYLAFDAAFSPGIGEILDRVADPGFDPNGNRADNRFVNSIEFEAGTASIIGWVIGGVAVLFGAILTPMLMFVQLASVNAGAPLAIAETYRQTLRRLPRIVGIYLLWMLVTGLVLVGLGVLTVLAAWASALSLIIIIPAAITTFIVIYPFGYIAGAMLVLGPTESPPFRTAIDLVKDRWGAVAGRILAFSVVGFSISLGINLVSAPLGAASVWATVFGGILFQLIQYAYSMSGAVVIYHWTGGQLDPALRGETDG